jgi:DNA-binding NarL/FixJ family response regulator
MLDVCIMAPARARLDSLERGLASDPSIRVAGAARTFALLQSLVADTSPDVVLIDLETEPASARDWIVELVNTLPIVVLAADYDADLFHRIMQAKSGGLLRPEASLDQLIQAIKSTAAGLTVFDSDLIPSRAGEDSLIEPLTMRETEVLDLLSDGLGNKEIALRLNISEHTIKFHIRSILGKLGASSRTEAVSRGLRSGLIEL